MSPEERRILEYLRKKETSSNKGIVKALAMDEKPVNQNLNSLRQLGLVVFKQEIHVTAGELIMARITSRGLNVAEELSKPHATSKSTDFGKARPNSTLTLLTYGKESSSTPGLISRIQTRPGINEYEKSILSRALSDLHSAQEKGDLKTSKDIVAWLSKVAAWLGPLDI